MQLSTPSVARSPRSGDGSPSPDPSDQGSRPGRAGSRSGGLSPNRPATCACIPPHKRHSHNGAYPSPYPPAPHLRRPHRPGLPSGGQGSRPLDGEPGAPGSAAGIPRTPRPCAPCRRPIIGAQTSAPLILRPMASPHALSRSGRRGHPALTTRAGWTAPPAGTVPCRCRRHPLKRASTIPHGGTAALPSTRSTVMLSPSPFGKFSTRKLGRTIRWLPPSRSRRR